jgi:DNA polymerase-3 subunit epsilon
LYTKRKLEEIYHRWNAKKTAERQAKAAAQPKPAEQAPKPEAPKTDYPKKEFTKQDHTKTQYPPKPFKKKDEPAQPVNDDMLQQLALKFKKG